MLRIIGATDKGLVRYVNEDRFAGEVFSPDLAYGVVCDGMGGENAGAVASAIACEEIRRMLESSCRPGMDQRSAYMVLESAVATANAVVYDKAEQDPEVMRGMGTTVCLALVAGEKVYLANVGDSRGYLLRAGELHRLTTDHTLARMLLDPGGAAPAPGPGTAPKQPHSGGGGWPPGGGRLHLLPPGAGGRPAPLLRRAVQYAGPSHPAGMPASGHIPGRREMPHRRRQQPGREGQHHRCDLSLRGEREWIT